jgi:hypothetical protein
MGSLLIVIVCAVALGPACDGKTKMLLGTDGSSGMPDSGAGGAGGAPDPGAGGAGGLIAPDSSSCDGSAMAGTWYRALDKLVMILGAEGCTITGTSDNPSYRHIITGTYNEAASTMIGTIERTTVSNGCITVMNATWVLTDPTHFTFAITSTDGRCDLLTTYNEVSTFVRQ